MGGGWRVSADKTYFGDLIQLNWQRRPDCIRTGSLAASVVDQLREQYNKQDPSMARCIPGCAADGYDYNDAG